MIIEGGNNETAAGATSATYKAIYHVPSGAAITAFPTAAGTATVYYSTSPVSLCKADIAAGHITSSNTAQWTAWSSGAVSAITREVSYAPLTALAVVPASGTWTLEVCR